jgi:hypothetical protein
MFEDIKTTVIPKAQFDSELGDCLFCPKLATKEAVSNLGDHAISARCCEDCTKPAMVYAEKELRQKLTRLAA